MAASSSRKASLTPSRVAWCGRLPLLRSGRTQVFRFGFTVLWEKALRPACESGISGRNRRIKCGEEASVQGTEPCLVRQFLVRQNREVPPDVCPAAWRTPGTEAICGACGQRAGTAMRPRNEGCMFGICLGQWIASNPPVTHQGGSCRQTKRTRRPIPARANLRSTTEWMR